MSPNGPVRDESQPAQMADFEYWNQNKDLSFSLSSKPKIIFIKTCTKKKKKRPIVNPNFNWGNLPLARNLWTNLDKVHWYFWALTHLNKINCLIVRFVSLTTPKLRRWGSVPKLIVTVLVTSSLRSTYVY